MRPIRHEDGTLTKCPDQLTCLRDLSNAKNLRAMDLEAFIPLARSERPTMNPNRRRTLEIT
ncbi:hypothetical protein ACOJVU_09645 [Mycobacterium sp. THU-M104]|uniref:hypothetical protein n=1 Tax=Mycobacterium sp. THU-M104 TaxID=3410515 RepID=UPI003B9C9512